MRNAPSPLPSWINYLCVEGVIGAGKTSFCNLLRREYERVRLVLEKAEENPFLEQFYNDRSASAFQTQLWFLVSRFRQLSGIVAQQDLFYEVTVSDYIFAKDRIFAAVNLSEDEMGLYDQIAQVMAEKLLRPDLVVYLQTSTDVLMRRIERRGRSYEYNMDPNYIATLNESYNHFFFHYSETPLLIVNTDELDFVNSHSDYWELVQQIALTGKGTNYYRPMAAKDKSRLGDIAFYQRLESVVPGDTVIEEPLELL